MLLLFLLFMCNEIDLKTTCVIENEVVSPVVHGGEDDKPLEKEITDSFLKWALEDAIKKRMATLDEISSYFENSA